MGHAGPEATVRRPAHGNERGPGHREVAPHWELADLDDILAPGLVAAHRAAVVDGDHTPLLEVANHVVDQAAVCRRATSTTAKTPRAGATDLGADG